MSGLVLLTVKKGKVHWMRVDARSKPIPWAQGHWARLEGDLAVVEGGSEVKEVRAGQATRVGDHATSCFEEGEGRGEKMPLLCLGEEIVTASESMARALHLAILAAPLEETVLICGESGTGKEVLARTIHLLGRRGPFVAMNMGAIPEDLAEAQLFGWVRGAFTGAVESRPGAFEAAQDGTLFLDEIGEASTAIQAKVLRAVESKSVCRVGSLRPIPVRARLIAATNRDLWSEVVAGRFRLDLLERLSCIVIRLPTLRERIEDIPYLAARLARSLPGSPEVRPDAVEVLMGVDWPGNVRGLRNCLGRAALLTMGAPINGDAVREALGDLPTYQGLREAQTPQRRSRSEEILASGLPRSTYYYRLKRGKLCSSQRCGSEGATY